MQVLDFTSRNFNIIFITQRRGEVSFTSDTRSQIPSVPDCPDILKYFLRAKKWRAHS